MLVTHASMNDVTALNFKRGQNSARIDPGGPQLGGDAYAPQASNGTLQTYHPSQIRRSSSEQATGHDGVGAWAGQMRSMPYFIERPNVSSLKAANVGSAPSASSTMSCQCGSPGGVCQCLNLGFLP